LRYVFKPLKIKTKYKNPSHVGLEIKIKNKNPTYLVLFFNPLSTWEGFLYFVFIFSGLKTKCKQFYYFGKQTTQ
jgi:hypothetical protein